MPHVITQACCGDAACVFACPVNAIQPNPADELFVSAEMLYIDPKTCVDCGACVAACPVGAISKDSKLAADQLPFVEINRLFHEAHPGASRPVQAIVPSLIKLAEGDTPLRVAIVGAGPAGMYAADELLKQDGVEVVVYDRLSTPYGLVRSGVAPDHQMTKGVDKLFRHIEDLPGFHYALGVDVGESVRHADLAARYSAVVYATGASEDRPLHLPGANLPGVSSATRFVAWYNGHPSYDNVDFDLSHRRVVIIGNGNVALDAARILTTDPSELAKSDISDVALTALRQSRVEEVVLLGRRGPEHAAFTLPELVGLMARRDLQVVVASEIPPAPEWADVQLRHKLDLLRSLPTSEAAGKGGRRIVLQFWSSPTHLTGQDVVEGVNIRNSATNPTVDDGPTHLSAGLVLTSVGYRGSLVRDLPFDHDKGSVPHQSGRVDGVPGTYVVGWIKRGPRGFIGTNKSCARETVNSLLEDVTSGALNAAPAAGHLPTLLRRWHPDSLDLAAWRRIDEEEVALGLLHGRPRVKKLSRVGFSRGSEVTR
ncbi:FAD-dependent oxidoreductase [Nocardioides stalactiti]|uniref:FAD-dependent oxidoreductase n=1 Tax=Nocardioides stalactiti TaxID=2755356 RepID=UPI0016037AAD|nr:FAD-dependent oxidoreductase [Nocardioides stalactiti]